jgi:hypothetical protein
MNLRVAFATVILFVAVSGGCTDKCSGVDCGPAPPLLRVIVNDTLTIDSTFYLQAGSRIDTVDSVMVVYRPVTDALVTLREVSGGDTLAFDTLAASGSQYQLDDAAGLPADPFFIAVERKGRHAAPARAQLSHVDACCSYPIVGRFSIALPQKP